MLPVAPRCFLNRECKVRSALALLVHSVCPLVRSLRWTKEPSDPTEALEGTDVSLDWDYDLQGATLRRLEWSDHDANKAIAEWDKSSEPLIFAAFQSRFSVDTNKKAALVIRNVNQTNNGRYSCDLQGLQNSAVQELPSIIQLRVVSKYEALRHYIILYLHWADIPLSVLLTHSAALVSHNILTMWWRKSWQRRVHTTANHCKFF